MADGGLGLRVFEFWMEHIRTTRDGRWANDAGQVTLYFSHGHAIYRAFSEPSDLLELYDAIVNQLNESGASLADLVE